MIQEQFKELYPIFKTTINKNETTCKSVDEIIEYLQAKIEAHPIATYIAIFDSLAHTSSLKEGKVNPDIKEAKNLLCCFGKELMMPEILSVRPRSFGIADMGEYFHISFLKAPNDAANDAMLSWVTSLKNI